MEIRVIQRCKISRKVQSVMEFKCSVVVVYLLALFAHVITISRRAQLPALATPSGILPLKRE